MSARERSRSSPTRRLPQIVRLRRLVCRSFIKPWRLTASTTGTAATWGNPALFPLIYSCHSRDILIVHVNPVERPGKPTSAHEIANRVNEISFNSSLMRELRAVAFVTKLIDDGKLSQGFLEYGRRSYAGLRAH